MKHSNMTEDVIMFFIMILAGLLSTMNVWVDKYDDIQFSLNDVYMVLLMTGWMFLFMGAFYKKMNTFSFGLFLVVVNLWCIRTQFLITQTQYLMGMIPHHSMAVHMSNQLLKKENNISGFLKSIVSKQSHEIEYMKHSNATHDNHDVL
jgi:hypothetical protein